MSKTHLKEVPKAPEPTSEIKAGQSCALLVEVSEDGLLWRATLMTKAGKKTNGWKKRERFNADLMLLKAEFGRFVLQGIGRPIIS